MPFENGSMSFRMLELPRAFQNNFVEKFAAEAAGSLDSIGTNQQRGWVTGRHLLDSHITEESAMLAGWVRLSLRLAERKVPAALLRRNAAWRSWRRWRRRGRRF